ncbi:conserved hypothetical protein [Uncinocarpus reesii 1704]|uniref:hydroxyethylthiazole kinase n=1 Tax=Uncinocarpus reesii (strain UAMH 1704) TaxID=336963 RepID=C4JDI7_UNCRE|nr:uncharacterized protein UREG_00763 [Uncinocarpus reesii 1704]EEP75916.1 conserved hypothetical protein [Uncinocarpus reesii 1704]
MPIDLSLYLVTDSTPKILGDRDLCAVVEQAAKGGVTIVQYRDKHADTGALIETAATLHKITRAHNIPLIINDRVMWPCVGAEESSRQDDMGNRYQVYHRYSGVKQILEFLSTSSRRIGTVAIGGINLGNAQRVIYQSQALRKGLDGIAIVSAVMAASEPQKAAAILAKAITKNPPFATMPPELRKDELGYFLDNAIHTVQKVATDMPLVHSMINYVVANFAANVSLQIGASPIMSPYGAEADDLANAGGSLLINMGTLNADSEKNYLQAMEVYNRRGNPVVLDPVGGGATDVRQNMVKALMAGGYFDLIKGNEGEIKAIYGQSPTRQIGVDSGPSTLGPKEKVAMVQDLASRERNIVLMTGPVDFLSDGIRTIAISNGHPYLGQITGTGCVIGLVAAAFLAVERTDKLLAVLAGVLMFEIAAENAASKEHVHGPGTFVPALLDELYALREATKADVKKNWIKDRAKFVVLKVDRKSNGS